MNDTKQPVSEKSPEYLAATLREVAETLDDVGKTIDARLGAWAEAAPEPEPPSVTLHYAITGTEYVLYSVSKISETHTTGAHIVGSGRIGSRAFTDAPLHVAETPAAIRAACAREGVPCVGEPEPKTVDVVDRWGDIWEFSAIDGIRAQLINDTPMVCVHGVNAEAEIDADEWCYAITPLADIRAQAEAAGIKLPDVVVDEGTSQWVKIERVDCRIHDGKLLTMVQGFAVGEELARSKYGTDLTPAQVLALCRLAGWPKPEVIDVSCVYHVREPVPVVRRMVDACKEGE